MMGQTRVWDPGSDEPVRLAPNDACLFRVGISREPVGTSPERREPVVSAGSMPGNV